MSWQAGSASLLCTVHSDYAGLGRLGAARGLVSQTATQRALVLVSKSRSRAHMFLQRTNEPRLDHSLLALAAEGQCFAIYIPKQQFD